MIVGGRERRELKKQREEEKGFINWKVRTIPPRSINLEYTKEGQVTL